MNLRIKILLGFSSVLVLVVIVWIWAIIHLHRLGSAGEAILQENYRSILAAEHMIGSIERQDSSLLWLLLGNEENGREQFRANEVEFVQWLSRAQDNITIEGEGELVQSIEDEYARYLSISEELDRLYVSQPLSATQYYYDAALPQFQLVRNQSVALRDLNQETMVRASEQAQQLASRTIWSTIVIGAATSLFGLGLSLWFSQFLTHPLREMSTAAEKIAEGNYAIALSKPSDDELGRLAQRIMTMSSKLRAYHNLNVGKLLAEKRRSEAIIHGWLGGGG